MKENDALKKRVGILEAKYKVVQKEQEELHEMVATLKDGIFLLCNQLSEAGLEPAFTLEELDGGD